jgi:hypothetical protein
MFTTAGYGPVPENVNLHRNDADRAIEHLRRLPVIGEADHIVKPASDGNYTDWHTYSAQGFYAYDWNIWHGPYIRLSVPTVPIAIGSLPPSMQAVARYAPSNLTSPRHPKSDSNTVNRPWNERATRPPARSGANFRADRWGHITVLAPIP